MIPNGANDARDGSLWRMPPTGDPQMVPQDPLPGPEDVPGGARTLSRSTTDKHVWGVAGGLGRYFGIDPVIFRVAFGAATLVSGVGLIAYIALRLLLPTDTGEPPWMEGRSRITTIVVTGVLSIIALTDAVGAGLLRRPGPVRRRGVQRPRRSAVYRAFGGDGARGPGARRSPAPRWRCSRSSRCSARPPASG